MITLAETASYLILVKYESTSLIIVISSGVSVWFWRFVYIWFILFFISLFDIFSKTIFLYRLICLEVVDWMVREWTFSAVIICMSYFMSMTISISRWSDRQMWSNDCMIKDKRIFFRNGVIMMKSICDLPRL